MEVNVGRLKSLADRFGVQCSVERDPGTGKPVAEDEEEAPTIVPCPNVGLCLGDNILDAGQGVLHVTARYAYVL